MKKRKVASVQICAGEEILYSGPVNRLPLREEHIIIGSIAFYDDSEPCFIHRSAVMSRYYMQILNWLDSYNKDNRETLQLSNFPDELKILLNFPLDKKDEKE